MQEHITKIQMYSSVIQYFPDETVTPLSPYIQIYYLIHLLNLSFDPEKFVDTIFRL